MHNPMDTYIHALRRILRYIPGIKHYGLNLYPSSNTSLLSYTYADWGGCPDTRRSTSGYCVYLGDNLLSWSSKRQPHSHTLVLKQNIMELPMWYLNLAGYETFCLSYNAIFIKSPWCTVTMLVTSTSQVTQFSINEQNTLRWTFISFVKRSLGVKSGFSISPCNIKSHIFLPKDFLSYFSKTSETTSASVHLLLQQRKSIRISL